MIVEKYRPTEFKDVIGIDKKVVDVVAKGDIPHLLFYGSAGTGKTTTALIIKNKLGCDTLKLNASDERGIDTIRIKVKSFASTTSSNGKYKIVFLDEADALTFDSQNALRNMMETYYSNCRFILTCNYINKICDPLLSRCQKFKVELPQKKDIYDRLCFIAKEEQIQIRPDALNAIVESFYPDIRSCINKLDSLNIGKEITIKDVNKDQLLVGELFSNLQTKPISYIRQWLLDNNVDYKQLIIEMKEYVWHNLKSLNGAAQIFLELAISNSELPRVLDQDLEFTRLLLRCKVILTTK